jgi:hypothetical protein
LWIESQASKVHSINEHGIYASIFSRFISKLTPLVLPGLAGRETPRASRFMAIAVIALAQTIATIFQTIAFDGNTFFTNSKNVSEESAFFREETYVRGGHRNLN